MCFNDIVFWMDLRLLLTAAGSRCVVDVGLAEKREKLLTQEINLMIIIPVLL